MIPGLDCGSPQGKITSAHWITVFKDRTWVFARCMSGIGPGVDPTFAPNVTNARTVGLKVGAYFVFIPGSDPQDDPVAQANAWFFGSGALGTNPGELPPAIDFEIASKQVAPQVELAALVSCIQAVTSLWGRAPVLYTYPDFWKRIISIATPDELAIIATCILWFASYESSPPHAPEPWTTATFWQSSGGDKYTLPNGLRCDADFFLGDEAALADLSSFILNVGPNPLAGVSPPLDIPGENA